MIPVIFSIKFVRVIRGKRKKELSYIGQLPCKSINDSILNLIFDYLI